MFRLYRTTLTHRPVVAFPLLFARTAHTDTNNHVIRKIDLSTWDITTVVGKEHQQQPRINSSCQHLNVSYFTACIDMGMRTHVHMRNLQARHATLILLCACF